MFICSFVDRADQVVMVRGRKVRFDFSELFGPLLLDDEGNPLKKQPISERDPFWPPFNAWLAEYRKVEPRAPPPLGKTDHLDKRTPAV